jgi:hypothetical protein
LTVEAQKHALNIAHIIGDESFLAWTYFPALDCGAARA